MDASTQSSLTKMPTKPKKRRETKMATFRRCEHFRLRAGLTKAALTKLLENTPKETSVTQLELGHSIRAEGAYRIANTLRADLEKKGLESFNAEDEVSIVKRVKKDEN
jgi:hypothetical protein